MTDWQEELKQMTEDAQETAMAQGGWLTEAQVLQRVPDLNPERLQAWLNEKRFFSVQYNGEEYFPGFLLDPTTHQPFPALKEIIKAFQDGGLTDWHITYWLSSANGYFDGELPRDLVQTADTQALVRAAIIWFSPVDHG